jgi:hypothetical protein
MLAAQPEQCLKGRHRCASTIPAEDELEVDLKVFARDAAVRPRSPASGSAGARSPNLNRISTSCETGLLTGQVDYRPEPVEPPAEGDVLICCSQPRGATILDL